MNNIRQLYELQEVDLEIDQTKQSLENVKSQIGEDDELQEANILLDAARKRLADLEQQQHSYEREIEDISSKIAKEEKKLYEGTGKNPKELLDLQKEVDLIKDRRRAKEDELLGIMERVDAEHQDVNQKSIKLQELEKQWKGRQRELTSEQKSLEADLESLHTSRKTIAQQIDGDTIRTYEHLRLIKNGRAVAKIEQGRCMGCRMSLPISDQQKARSGKELATCSNCGRILHIT